MKNIFTLLFILISATTFSQVRISQVYGGGGNAGATYTQDFVELFNAGASSVDISGWSVQYASATGTAWQVVAIPAATSIAAGKYYLVGLSVGGAVGVALPAPDATGAINMSGTAGKVALVNSATALSGATACTDPSVQDVVGFGATASCSETSPASTTGTNNTMSVTRNSAGCAETNNNILDFALASVNPRNSATAASPCSSGPSLSAGPNVTGLSTSVGTASTPQTYTLSGSNLTGAPGNITLTTSSANIEVSLNSGSGYSTSINVPYASATLAPTTIYVRISATAPLGTVSASVLNSGGGATNATVTVSGTVVTSEPTVQANNIILSAIADHGMTINWTNGNGTSRIVVIRQTATTEVVPVDGTVYTANTDIATAGTTGGGNYVVYSGSGSGPISVTGLTAGTSYTVRVYEYNGSAGSNNYLTTTATLNPNSASTTGISPALQQLNFTSVSTPLYTGSGNATRTPTMFFATVSNLAPSTTYKYYVQAAIGSDLGTTATGAGNSILIDYTVNPVTYTYASSLSLNTAGGYGKFTTNASGSFTGSFGFVNTGNARFTAGNAILPNITLAVDGTTPVEFRFALNQTITVLAFANTNGATDGTFIQGTSLATPGNLVALWKSVDGTSIVNQVSARPLSMTISENPTVVTGNGGSVWASSFITGYDLTSGSWNTIIPNDNPNGVRLIQQFNIRTGVVIGCNSDADGTWPTGPVVTANPTGGLTPLQISSTDAPINGGTCFDIIPVKLSAFNVQKINNIVKLSWTTEQELNSKEFIIERSINGNTWTTIATVAAAGNSNSRLNYTSTDNSPVKGINFYRIRSVDFDNRFDLSATKSVLFNSAVEVLVTPNPAKDIVNVYMADNNRTVNILLLDASGKVVKKLSTDQQQLQINVSAFGRGVYYVKVVNEGSVKTTKILLQ